MPETANEPWLVRPASGANAAQVTGERSSEGFFHVRCGIEQAIARGLAYAPYADLLWCETSKPNIDEARRFADAIHARYPEKMLAPLRPALVLPEVLDPTKWRAGKLWFTDPEERYVLRLFNTVDPVFYINTQYVKPGEISAARSRAQSAKVANTPNSPQATR